MTIEQLRRFAAVVYCGNVSKAAETCKVTPQAVSKSVRGLEQEIGAPLLIKTGGGNAKLTPLGRELCLRAVVLIREFDKLRTLALAAGVAEKSTAPVCR